MGSDWVNDSLGNVLEIKYGKDHKKLPDGEIPCYGTGGVMRKVDTSLYDDASILIPRKGSLNNIYFINEPFWTVDTLFWTKIDKSLIDPKFLFYQLKLTDFASLNVGSAVPSLTVPVLNDLKIKYPSLSEQKAIAHILGSLDDKIELNRQMNETLESMAQALFKSWFVDFDPVIDNALAAGNPIPDVFAERAEQRRELKENAEKSPSRGIAETTSEHSDDSPQGEVLQKPHKSGGVSFNGSENRHKSLFPSEFEFTEEMGWIPKGWGGNNVESLIELIGGGTPKTSIDEYWNGNIPWFSVVDAPNSSDVFVIDTEKHVTELGVEKSSTKILPVGTTIISARGTVGKCAIVAKPMAMNQSCYGVRGKGEISDSFVYYLIYLSVVTLQQRGHGSVFNTITRETFKSIHTPFCGEELTIEFDSLVKPLLDKMLANSIQAHTLSKLRDTLLPKLLSGKLRVPDAEKLIKDAGV